MAQEQAPPIHNTRLLIIAIVLAVIVVAIYNLQLSRIRKAATEQTVKLLMFKTDLSPGRQIEARDFAGVPITEEAAKGLTNVVTAEKEGYIVGNRVTREVRAGKWVQWDDVVNLDIKPPSSAITTKMVTYDLPVDRVPGNLLRVGDRINVLGMISLPNAPLKAYRIIEDLKVLTIGGQGMETSIGSARPVSSEGLRSYRTITVEVSKPSSLELANALSHVQGSVWIELRNPEDSPPAGAGQVAQELRSLPAAPSRNATVSIEGPK